MKKKKKKFVYFPRPNGLLINMGENRSETLKREIRNEKLVADIIIKIKGHAEKCPFPP